MLFLRFIMLFIFSSSLSSFVHPGQGHHPARRVSGMAAARAAQRRHPGVRGQVLREGE